MRSPFFGCWPTDVWEEFGVIEVFLSEEYRIAKNPRTQFISFDH
jgi:hypothetical protein